MLGTPQHAGSLCASYASSHFQSGRRLIDSRRPRSIRGSPDRCLYFQRMSFPPVPADSGPPAAYCRIQWRALEVAGPTAALALPVAPAHHDFVGWKGQGSRNERARRTPPPPETETRCNGEAVWRPTGRRLMVGSEERRASLKAFAETSFGRAPVLDTK